MSNCCCNEITLTSNISYDGAYLPITKITSEDDGNTILFKLEQALSTTSLMSVSGGEGIGVSAIGGTYYIENLSPNIDQKISLVGSTLTLDRGGGSITLPSLSIDGSETKIVGGVNIGVTGTGTTASPYTINSLVTPQTLSFDEETKFLYLKSGESVDSSVDLSSLISAGTVTSVGIASETLSVDDSPVVSSGIINVNIGTNTIDNALIRKSQPLSVMGNSTDGLSDVEDITAEEDFTVLTRTGDTIAFRKIVDDDIIYIDGSKIINPYIANLQEVTTKGNETNKLIIHNDVGILKKSSNNGNTVNPTSSSIWILKNPAEISLWSSSTNNIYLKMPEQGGLVTGVTRIYKIKGTFLSARTINNGSAKSTDFEIRTITDFNGSQVTINLSNDLNNDFLKPIRLIHNGTDVRLVFGSDASPTKYGFSMVINEVIGRQASSAATSDMQNPWTMGYMTDADLAGYTVITYAENSYEYGATHKWVEDHVNSKILKYTSDPLHLTVNEEHIDTVTIVGAEEGDVIVASHLVQPLFIRAYCDAPNSVKIIYRNLTINPINLSGEIIKLRIIK